MDLIAIKTNKGYYVSDNIKDESYFNTRIFSNKYDVEITKTYHKDWGFCEKLPSLIYKKEQDTYINKRWELKAGFPESELTPKVIYKQPDGDIYGLYLFKQDEVKGKEFTENITVEIIVEQNDFEIKQTSINVSYNLIDRICTPSILLVNKATKISSVESFKIIRTFVKANLDAKCAKITSDYDFHFKVEKLISHVPEEYRRDISGTRSKKAKYVTDYRRYRTVKILGIYTPGSNYSDSILSPEFSGGNYDDCMLNLNYYLEKLRIEITTPLTECPHCNGTGIQL